MTTLTPEQRQDVARRFQGLAARWEAVTRYRSHTNSLRDHPVYQELIGLGEPVIPLILAEVARKPAVSWLAALATITGESPVPPDLAGHVEAMARAWIDWGRQRGYVE
jgi:hypothetical protein